MPTRSEITEDEQEFKQLILGVGNRIRSLRLGHHLTLQDLASAVGLSASTIGAVERGEITPSISTLYRLSTELDVKLESFFSDKNDSSANLILKDSQQLITTPGGVQRRLIRYNPNLSLELYMDTYLPGAAHAPRPSKHRGIEIGTVINGTLNVDVDSETYLMHEGDSIQYAANSRHLIHNDSEQISLAMWINLRRLG